MLISPKINNIVEKIGVIKMKTKEKSVKKKKYDYENDDYIDENHGNYEDEDTDDEDNWNYEDEDEIDDYNEIYS